jgi:two-component system chemotaxis response regulator CheY
MKVLVVDDDVVSRMALSDLLSGFGAFEVLEAEDVEVAWRMLNNGLRPVICFCDIRMPNLSGIDLLKRLKVSTSLRDIPFVLVSSASDRDTVLRAIKLGAKGYILKPFDVTDARLHLEQIFKNTIDRVAEHPVDTLKRLNIGPERLTTYLSAFQVQLESGLSDLQTILLIGDSQSALSRIDTLHSGCQTLGLWFMASVLDSVRKRELVFADISTALLDTVGAVHCQSSRLHALFNAAPV